MCQTISALVDQKPYMKVQEENKVEMEILCKFMGGNFHSGWLLEKKWNYLQRSSVCSGKFPFDLHIPYFVFQQVELA